MTTTESPPRRGRKLTPEKVFDLLMSARTEPWVTIFFADSRVLSGAVIFNEYKGTGRIINIDEEVSIDFSVDEVRDVRI